LALWDLRLAICVTFVSLDQSEAQKMLTACLAGSPAAWDDFLSRFHRVIVMTVVRTGGVRLPIDDLVQDTYVRLCADRNRVLRDARIEHPNALYGLIQAVARSVTLDFLRNTRALKKGGALDIVSLDALLRDVELPGPKDLEWPILLAEIASMLEAAGVPEREQTIFWLYYRQGLTARAIANLPGVNLNESGVESLLRRLTKLLKTHIGSTGSSIGFRLNERGGGSADAP
jgi:RNA polymerase sigma-70 factor, ECF subfamily